MSTHVFGKIAPTITLITTLNTCQILLTSVNTQVCDEGVLISRLTGIDGTCKGLLTSMCTHVSGVLNYYYTDRNRNYKQNVSHQCEYACD